MILSRRSILTAAALLATLTTAQAQDRQVTVYSGPTGIELPASLLRGSAPAVSSTAGDTSAPRKIRIIVASPYGN